MQQDNLLPASLLLFEERRSFHLAVSQSNADTVQLVHFHVLR